MADLSLCEFSRLERPLKSSLYSRCLMLISLKADNAYTEQMKRHQRQRHVPRHMKKTSWSVDQPKSWCSVLGYRLNVLIFMVTVFLRERIHCDYTLGRKSQGSLRRDECFKIKTGTAKLSILYSSCQSQCHYAHVCWGWRDYTASKILQEITCHFAVGMLHWYYAHEYNKWQLVSTSLPLHSQFISKVKASPWPAKVWGTDLKMHAVTDRQRERGREAGTETARWTGTGRQWECISLVYMPQRTLHPPPGNPQQRQVSQR